MNITICTCGGDTSGTKVTVFPKAPQPGVGVGRHTTCSSGPSMAAGMGGGEARKKGEGAREATVERAALWGRWLL